MKNKLLIIIFAIITSLAGSSLGFFVTRAYVPKEPEAPIETLSVVEIKEEEAVLEIKDLTESGVKTEEEKKDEVVKKPNKCSIPKKEYVDASYLDVGPEVPLEDKTYIPSSLVELAKSVSKYANLCVKEEVAQALNLMISDAKKENLNIIVSSGFRDYNTQKSILDTNIASGNKNATKLIAKPGHSEHQLGVAIDFTSPSIGNVSATGKFGDTLESKWLEENASKYGFVLSYPKGKEDITGYLYEPWHYRYVGIEHAIEIVNSGKTINEYFKEIKESDINKKSAL